MLKCELKANLPEAHLKTLSFLCSHLKQVCSYEKDNHMNPTSMAIVWGMSITWPAVGEAPQMTMAHCSAVNQLMEYLIAYEQEIFK